MTFQAILASSTALLQTAVDTLVQAVFAFLPIILYVAIPLALLYAGWRWVSHRARIR